MNGFDYVSAANLQDALDILSREKEDACLLAGATNVVNKMHLGRIRDKRLVSLEKVDELRGISEEGDFIVIGAMTDMNTIARSALIKEKAHVLWEAAQFFADPVTNNRATIGGNIADASPAADCAPPLMVLNADVLIKSVRGERVVPIEEFFVFVGKTVLQPDELVTAFRFKSNGKGAYIKIGLRNALAISVSSVAATLQLDDDGKVIQCAIALGSVAPTPVRAYTAEKALLGRKLTDEVLKEAGEAVKKDISPIDDIRATAFYRLGVSATITERALRQLA